MNRLHRNLIGSLLIALGANATPLAVRAQMTESPISPGFWSFPRQKLATPQDVVAACRLHFEVQFADGHFFGLRTEKNEKNVIEREVDDVGHCQFDRQAQVDHCEMHVMHPDGSVLTGTLDSKYSYDPDKTLKMTVMPKPITDTPGSDAPYDVYPVRCPADAVWGGLNEIGQPK